MIIFRNRFQKIRLNLHFLLFQFNTISVFYNKVVLEKMNKTLQVLLVVCVMLALSHFNPLLMILEGSLERAKTHFTSRRIQQADTESMSSDKQFENITGLLSYF